MVSHEIPEIAGLVAMPHDGRIEQMALPPPSRPRAKCQRVSLHRRRGRRSRDGVGGKEQRGRMEQMRVNVAVAVFVLLGILAPGYLSIKLRRVSFFGEAAHR
jgi:hypothetical protein